MAISRRGFLLGAGAVVGGGFAIGYVALRSSDATHAQRAAALVERDGARLLAGWILISPDDAVSVLIPHVDIGQGVHTALAMMAAEELDADWSKVRAVQAPVDETFANWFLAEGYTVKNRMLLDSGAADPLFRIIAGQIGLQMTAGSIAVRFTGEFGLRAIGAAARQMLLEAAAQRWTVDTSSLVTRSGKVIHEATRRELRYGELIEVAAQQPVPARPSLKPRDQYRLIGTSVPRDDISAKVLGTHAYAIDVRLPEMRYATTRAAPVHGGRLLSVDAAPARAVAGVEHIIELPDSVAVVARAPWQAFRALNVLEPKFSDERAGGVSTQSLYADQLRALNRSDRTEKLRIGDVQEVLPRSQRKLEAIYRAPFLHHAQMEPINVVAQWVDDRLTVWSGTQNPLATRNFLADLAQISTERVVLHALPLGGAFGRKTDPDHSAIYYAQVVALARKTAPHPVKLIWTREEDTAQGWYRPLVTSRITAALGPDGLPIAWSQVFIEGRPGRSIGYPLPYAIPNQLFEEVAAPNHIRKGPFRSVNHTQHGLWRESFVDELAHFAGQDPLEYRLAMLTHDARARRVLEEVRARSNWSSPLPPGVGRGVALSVDCGSVIAEVVEASWEQQRVKVHRVVAVVDCGQVVHPDTAAQQIEGAIVMGLSSAVAEEITIRDGAVAEKLFTDYRIFTLADTPRIEVHFLNSDAPIGGLGEVGMPATPPALANALFSATGLRARRTPLNAALVELSVQSEGLASFLIRN